MKKQLSYLLTGVLAMGLVGCGGSSASSAAAPASSAAEEPAASAVEPADSSSEAAPAETSGSEMTVAIAMQFDTLDPALSTTVYNAYVINSIYGGLYVLDENALPVLDLAEDVQTSDDGLTWTFKLRQDAVFSDGTPIKAENYVFACTRALSYGAENAFRTSSMAEYLVGGNDYRVKALEAGPSFDCLTEDHSELGVEAVDDYTLVYHLTHPVPYLDVNLCGGGVWSALPLTTPQHTSEWSITPGYPTSGPYDLESIDMNDAAVVTKSATYYDQSRVVMEKIIWQVMTDPSAQEAAFKRGDIDVALSVSTDGALSYQGTDNLWMLQYPSTYSLCVNSASGNEALKDVRVRKALYMAINKEAVVNVIGNTDMYPILNGYVPYGLPGANGDFRTEGDARGDFTITYNPEEAVKLLNEAGYNENNKLQLTYKYSKNSFHEDVATMLQSMWRELGCVDVTFDATEGNVYYGEIDEGKIEIGRYGLQTDDSPMTMLKNWTSTNLVAPLIGDNGEYDKMIADAAMIADPVEFAEALHQAEKYLIEDNCFQFPMFQFAQPALVQSNLKNYQCKITTLDFEKCVKE